MVAVSAGGSAAAQPAQTGLAGLQSELNSTGRVGAIAPRTPSQIEAASSGSAAPSRAPRPATVRPNESAVSPDDHAAGLGEEYRQTDAPVAACRIEVARRRRVSPNKLAAGTVTLRFTVESNGHVRDAEAVSASNTDLEIAACAKRVLSGWVFAKRPGGAITVERTYRTTGRTSADDAADRQTSDDEDPGPR